MGNLTGSHNHKKTRHSGMGRDGMGMEIRLDLDETVQRLEKEMDDVTITSPTGAGTRGAVATAGTDMYGDDILPGGAEHMGSGNALQ